MAEEADILDHIAEQLKAESGAPLTHELISVGEAFMQDNADTAKPMAVVTGMAQASMKLCEEHDPLRYYDFLLALGGHIHNELDRVRDTPKLPRVR